MSNIKNVNTSTINNISYVSAIIDGVEYKNITPKIILNRGIISPELFPDRTNIEYKSNEYTTPGINVVDIDWNGAVIENNEINTTSDLLTLLAKMYVNANNNNNGNSKYSWQNIVVIDENIELYYEDENGNVLTNYEPFTITHDSINTITKTSIPSNIISTNIAPYKAKQIGVYKNNIKQYILPLTNPYFDVDNSMLTTRLYRIGLISDAHHDDTCEIQENTIHNISDSGNDYDSYGDLEKLLTLIDDLNNDGSHQNIQFISSSGDISTNYIQQVESFYNHVKTHSNLPVFTCKGNHDNMASYGEENNNLWKQYTIPGITLDCINNAEPVFDCSDVTSLTNITDEIQFFTDEDGDLVGDGSSFYFVHKKCNDVYIYLNLDYNANTTSADTTNLIEGDSYQYYNPDVIRSLQSILDNYRHHRCFVFTHQPFAQKSGNVIYDYSKCHNQNYVLSGYQFVLLNEMNNHYKNSVWFSGHTHYQWKWQAFSSRANVCNWDILDDNYNYNNYYIWGKNSDLNNPQDDNLYEPDADVKEAGWSVHLPSLSRPLVPECIAGGSWPKTIMDPAAECGIMDVYENGVNIRGVVLQAPDDTIHFATNLSSDSPNELINGIVSRKVVASDIFPSKSKQYTEDQIVTELPDDIIELTFTCNAQTFIITNGLSSYADFDYIRILTASNEDITDLLREQANPYIGVWRSSMYYLTDSVQSNVASDNITGVSGLEITTSSNFASNNGFDNSIYPIKFQFKMHTKLVDPNYDSRKYSSVANYWLPVGGNNIKTIDSKTFDYFTNIAESHRNNE